MTRRAMGVPCTAPRAEPGFLIERRVTPGQSARGRATAGRSCRAPEAVALLASSVHWEAGCVRSFAFQDRSHAWPRFSHWPCRGSPLAAALKTRRESTPRWGATVERRLQIRRFNRTPTSRSVPSPRAPRREARRPRRSSTGPEALAAWLAAEAVVSLARIESRACAERS